MNIGGFILHKILKNPSAIESLEAWSKLRLAYFDSEYLPIYNVIAHHYQKYNELPSFNDCIITLRDGLLKSNITALEKLDVPEEIDIFIIVDALINEFTQNEALKYINSFIDNVTALDAEEIKQEISNIVMYLDEKTNTSDTVYLMNEITTMPEEEINKTQIPLNFSNTFDAEIKALTSELILLGGKRGSGKSVLSTNIFTSQYLLGNSCLYFSIEMKYVEVYNRMLSILSGVEFSKIRNNKLDFDDKKRLAKVKADMFMDADDLYNEFLDHKNYQRFELALNKNKNLKDNQLVIIDNQRLTLADIDLNIQKFKSKYGEKLKVVVVDYVNQIEIENMYDWKQQVLLAKQLKNMARKYDIVMISPYQIDASGEARFSKGLLDSPDMAIQMSANDDHLELKSAKTRSSAPFEIKCPMNWDTLTVSPLDYIEPIESSEDVSDKNEDLPF